MKNIFLKYSLMIINFCLMASFCQAQQTLILQPGPDEGKDAFLDDYYPYGNYGDYPNIVAHAGTAYGYLVTARSLFQFDLSQIAEDAIVLDARLDLYFAINPYNPGAHQEGDNQAWIRRVTEDWDEHDVFWTSQPDATSQDQVLLPASDSVNQDYLDIDMTVPIQEMVSNPDENFGFMIQLVTEVAHRYLWFASSDYVDSTLRPRLRITFIGCLLPDSQFDYVIVEDSIFFTDQSSSADTWLWDFGDGDTSMVQNPAHHYAEEGNYTVCLTVTDSCGSDVHCEEVVYCENAPVVDFGYDVQGSLVNFHDSTLLASSWWWSFGDGYYSNLQNPVHQYEQSGEYLVCLTAENSCGSATWCDTVNVCQSPETYFTYFIDDLEVSFTDWSNEAYTWWWDFGDGYFSDLQNPIHIYNELGTYEVCLTAINGCGEETYCEILSVYSVGINEEGATSLEVFPNPAKGQVYVRSGIQDEFKYALITLEGRIVKEGLLNLSPGTTEKIDLLYTPPGIYLLRLASGNMMDNIKLVVF